MRFIRQAQIDPRSKLGKALSQVTNAKSALHRGEEARDEAQIIDAINSANLFIKLAKSALDGSDEARLKVSTDRFGKTTVHYQTPAIQPPPRNP